MCFQLTDLVDPTITVNLRKLASDRSDFKRTDLTPLVVQYSGHGSTAIYGGYVGGFTVRDVEPISYATNWLASTEQQQTVRRIARLSQMRQEINQDPSFFLEDGYIPWQEPDMTQRRLQSAGATILSRGGAIYYAPKLKVVFTSLEIEKRSGSQWLISMALQETEILTPA